MRTLVVSLAGLLMLIVAHSDATAATIVAPNAESGVEGNTAGNYFPNGVGQRKLYDIDASQFSALAGGGLITGLAFRPDATFCPSNCGAFSPTTIHGITITLATTSISPATSDGTYADYLTTNVQTVFSGDATVSSGNTGPAAGPEDFDILFPFTSNYTYDPADGNLVVDIVITSTDGLPITIDAVASPSVMSEYFGPGTGQFSSQGNSNSNVDIIQFTTSAVSTPVPEPGTLQLLLTAVAGILGWRMMRRIVAPLL